MVQFRTKGELEAAMGNAVLKFEREYFGRGPREISTHVVKDLVLIRQRGILTPAEEQVRNNPESVELIQRLRETLLRNNQEVLRVTLQNLTQAQVLALYTDLSVEHSEKFMVFTFDQDLEARFRRSKRHSG
ncbi:MAG: DUF2294 domain-containing protein [Firmicutes bacterium]|nr:DUF2294 domain-containing protein [Bacillota bacterium]